MCPLFEISTIDQPFFRGWGPPVRGGIVIWLARALRALGARQRVIGLWCCIPLWLYEYATFIISQPILIAFSNTSSVFRYVMPFVIDCLLKNAMTWHDILNKNPTHHHIIAIVEPFIGRSIEHWLTGFNNMFCYGSNLCWAFATHFSSLQPLFHMASDGWQLLSRLVKS